MLLDRNHSLWDQNVQIVRVYCESTVMIISHESQYIYGDKEHFRVKI